MPGPLVGMPLQPACPSCKPGRCGGEDGAPTLLILCSWPWWPASGQQLGVVCVCWCWGKRTLHPNTLNLGLAGQTGQGELVPVHEGGSRCGDEPPWALPCLEVAAEKGVVVAPEARASLLGACKETPGLLGPSPGTMALWNPRGTLEKEEKKGRWGCAQGAKMVPSSWLWGEGLVGEPRPPTRTPEAAGCPGQTSGLRAGPLSVEVRA